MAVPDAHTAEIERCNQRGGRMLSVVDLLEAGTLDAAMAAYLLAAIGKGHSFMVGAGPGGTGKTTVMCALLNFVPNGMPLVPAADGEAVRVVSAGGTPACAVCHEIGRGSWYAYLWGRAAAAFFRLPAAGHMVATNLHADTIEEAEAQLVGDCGVDPADFRRMAIVVFMTALPSRALARRVTALYESAGDRHRLLFRYDAARDAFTREAEARLATPAEETAAGALLARIADDGARTVRDVRRRVVDGRA